MTSTFLTLFLLFLLIFGVHAVLTCGPSEYQSANEECCPMCNIGSVVLRDCHGDYSTTCKPCSKGTFMNEPNGLHHCFPCKTCDLGLYILHSCTAYRNAVCEVSDGYYCSEYSNKECSHATAHSVCEPGQQIKTPGTKTSDTVCEPCLTGFYSPDGVTCTKWTDCSVNNEIEDQKGNSTRNVKCKPISRKRHGLTSVGAVTGAAIVAAVAYLSVTVLYLKPKQASRSSTELNTPVEETAQESSGCASSSAGPIPIVDK